MKLISSISLLVYLSLCYPSAAQTVEVPLNTLTNLFLNVEDFNFAANGMTVAYMDKKKLEQAKKSDQSKPENQDPNGNWGTASEGFRLSLRFVKPEYTNGEPIEAIVLARNASQQTLNYVTGSSDWDLHFLAYDSKNRPLQDLHPTDFYGTGSKDLVVFPGTQRRFIVKLNRHFNFEPPGDYTVTVQARVPKLVGGGLSDVASGTATLKILTSGP